MTVYLDRSRTESLTKLIYIVTGMWTRNVWLEIRLSSSMWHPKPLPLAECIHFLQSCEIHVWICVYSTVFPDKEKSQKELMKTHEVFLKAMAYYKKKLHIRLRFEEDRLILVHFLNILMSGCKMCSLKLSHIDGKWSCKYCFQMPTQWNVSSSSSVSHVFIVQLYPDCEIKV